MGGFKATPTKDPEQTLNGIIPVMAKRRGGEKLPIPGEQSTYLEEKSVWGKRREKESWVLKLKITQGFIREGAGQGGSIESEGKGRQR